MSSRGLAEDAHPVAEMAGVLERDARPARHGRSAALREVATLLRGADGREHRVGAEPGAGAGRQAQAVVGVGEVL